MGNQCSWTKLLLSAAAATAINAGHHPVWAQSESALGLPQRCDWVELGGTIVATDATAFRLDYAHGRITVLVQPTDWYRYLRPLLIGNPVVVYGCLIPSTYGGRSIEASTVYVADFGQFFDALRRERADRWTYSPPERPGNVEVTGIVTSVRGRSLKLRSGSTINTSKLGYDPFDVHSSQHIAVGDLIQVAGDLGADRFDQPQIVAVRLANLSRLH